MVPVRRDYVTVVTGLPRSGTSMMMRMLESGGIPPLTDHVRAPDDDNPRGYYEYEPVKTTARDASWLEAAVGKAVKMVYRLLHDLPLDYSYRVIFMRRRLSEVFASQEKMLDRAGKGRSAMNPDQFESLFGSELRKAEQYLAQRSAFRTCYIDYDAIVATPEPQLRTIDRLLGGLDIEAMAGVVEPSLYRQRRSP